jgi:hypothetical protein
MSFTLNDFDSLLSKNKSKIKKVNTKIKNLAKQVGLKIDYIPGVYKFKNRFTGFFTKSKNSKVFFNLQINSEDLSLEWQIEDKKLILKFIKNVKLGTIKKFKDLGDYEIAIWDKNKKVCKLYPEYIDDLSWKFLETKIKKTNKPIFKFRKIYSRDNPILKSNKLESDIVKSIKQAEILNKYI